MAKGRTLLMEAVAEWKCVWGISSEFSGGMARYLRVALVS